MTHIFGSTGNILRVSLSSGTISQEATENYALRFLGGRGVGQFILFDELEPGADPLGPANKVILSTAPLTGTFAPSAGRMSVDWKNPQTGGVGSANVGGHFAPELKYAGFDGLIIEGQSEKPVFLLITNDKVAILDAGDIWGKTTGETEDILKQRLGDSRIRIASIGPAGENLVKGACLIVDRARAAGKGGCGAVLGAKKLKAIAARGTKAVVVHDPVQFLEEARKCWQKIDSARAASRLRAGGTLGNYGGTCETRNYQGSPWSQEKVTRTSFEVLRDNHEVRRLACFGCPTYCSHFYEVRDGAYAGLACEGLEINSLRAFGPTLDIDYLPAIIRGHALCSQLGIDVDFASATLGWAFESYQRNVLDIGDTDGKELVWGNHAAALGLLEDIAYRRGIGDLLAEGTKHASQVTGKGSEKWALHIKGADLSEQTVRNERAWALGLAVAARGGGHLEGARRVANQLSQLTPERSQALYGTSDIGKPNEYSNKEKVQFYFERFKGIVDSVGICYLLSQWTDLDLLGPEECASLYSSATGIRKSADELMLIGQRIHNVQKAFNTLHAGFSREDDTVPVRFMTEPVKSGTGAGEILDKGSLDRMLDAYYRLQGWEVSTGRQARACLESLGLNDVAAKLERYGELR